MSDCQNERLKTVRFGVGIPAVSGYNGLRKTNLATDEHSAAQPQPKEFSPQRHGDTEK
jgi:hypothetical protein